MAIEPDDSKEFGPDAWVYCKSHVRPHSTGWCTVPSTEKIKLEAKTRKGAHEECRARGLRVFEYDKN